MVDVILKRLKVRQEEQEAKKRPEEAKQEAETASVKKATDGFTTQLNGRELNDSEPNEEASSHAKGE